MICGIRCKTEIVGTDECGKKMLLKLQTSGQWDHAVLSLVDVEKREEDDLYPAELIEIRIDEARAIAAHLIAFINEPPR